jgi:hypothetical protein
LVSVLKGGAGAVGGGADAHNHPETHLEDRIAQIMHQQAENAVKKVAVNSKQDAAMKQAILAQYGEVIIPVSPNG